MNSQHRPWYGASWKVAGFACYAGLNAIARYLTGGANTQLQDHLPVPVIVFWQDFIALLFLLPWMLRQAKASFFPSHLGLHLFRVIVSAIAIIAWYFTIQYMPLAQAVALSVIGPLLGVIGAKWFLKERFGWLRTVIILLSLCGACFVVKPGSALLHNQSNTLGLLCLCVATSSFA
ncbi:MAG TPA: DMT family transporter, partial [Candidatus Berkiella sp.]|nr:DMT family transporter [Candidatus Berkiella sp.]